MMDRRDRAGSFALRALLVLGLVQAAVGAPLDAQGPVQRHFPSVSVFASLNIVPPPKTDDEARFEAEHLDVATADEHLKSLKRVRPSMPLLKYRLVETSIVGTEEAAVMSYCSAHGQDAEDAFLHYRDDAEVRTPKGVVRVPGWGAGTAPSRAAARVKLFMWTDWRWVFNLRAACVLGYLGARSAGDIARSDQGPPHDGLFVDELPAPDNQEAVGALPLTTQPARIIEYGDRVRAEVIRSGDYTRAVCAALTEMGRAMKAVAPSRGWVMSNTAQWLSGGVLALGRCSDGIVTEAMARESATQGDEGELEVWRFAAQLDSAGKLFVIVPEGLTPPSYAKLDAGNYPSVLERHQMYGLTSYWMARRGPRTLYRQGVEWRPMSTFWMKAQEVDIGGPRGDPYVWREDRAQGDSSGQRFRIYRRDYDRAVILFRTRLGWQGRDFQSFTSPTPPFPLGGCYQVLLPSGRLGPQITRISLRLSEGVALMPCASSGSDSRPNHPADHRSR